MIETIGAEAKWRLIYDGCRCCQPGNECVECHRSFHFNMNSNRFYPIGSDLHYQDGRNGQFPPISPPLLSSPSFHIDDDGIGPSRKNQTKHFQLKSIMKLISEKRLKSNYEPKTRAVFRDAPRPVPRLCGVGYGVAICGRH